MGLKMIVRQCFGVVRLVCSVESTMVGTVSLFFTQAESPSDAALLIGVFVLNSSTVMNYGKLMAIQK